MTSTRTLAQQPARVAADCFTRVTFVCGCWVDVRKNESRPLFCRTHAESDKEKQITIDSAMAAYGASHA